MAVGTAGTGRRATTPGTPATGRRGDSRNPGVRRRWELHVRRAPFYPYTAGLPGDLPRRREQRAKLVGTPRGMPAAAACGRKHRALTSCAGPTAARVRLPHATVPSAHCPHTSPPSHRPPPRPSSNPALSFPAAALRATGTCYCVGRRRQLARRRALPAAAAGGAVLRRRRRDGLLLGKLATICDDEEQSRV